MITPKEEALRRTRNTTATTEDQIIERIELEIKLYNRPVPFFRVYLTNSREVEIAKKVQKMYQDEGWNVEYESSVGRFGIGSLLFS